MKQTTLLLCSLFFFNLILFQEKTIAQISTIDYQRADSVMKRSDLVYSAGIQPEWIDSSSFFWYKNHEKDGDFFYLVNAETGEKHRSSSKEQLARIFSKKQQKFVDALLKDNSSEKKSRWNGNTPLDPVISPDRKWKAYIKDNNVFISKLDTIDKSKNEEIRLTHDGSVNFRYDGYNLQWSPDSRKLATVRIKDVSERKIPLLESSPVNQKQPILQWRDYAKPGDVIPVQLPVLFDIESFQQLPVNTSAYENQYELRFTGWRQDSRAFSFEFNQRGHQRYIIGEVDANNGNIRHLIDEQVKTFIYYYNNYRYDLRDGKEIVWISERDGWRHLYLFRDSDKPQQITKGEWVVRNVDFVDEINRKIYFTASGFNKNEDPYNLHYCKINMDGTDFIDLTPENGNHRVRFSFDRAYFTDVYSRPDLPAISLLRRTSDGSVVAQLEECDVTNLLATGWQMPEVFSAKGRDLKTEIWGNIHRPSNFDPTRKYPVIEMIYAGPHDSHVDKDFKPANHLISKVTELGFIVVSIDGMGTGNRSKSFHDVAWKNLKDAGFPDRISWIKSAAEKYPYMDTDRVGIYGWSAGGQNAMAALLFHNDFYKVAVALCGCHDNRMDKIWWNEQWMGYPVDESYSASSNVDNAYRLKGKLLLINGELDDNVDPASTLQVVYALMNAGKNFDQLYLPGKTHSLGGSFEMHKMYDFFVQHLHNQIPPDWN